VWGHGLSGFDNPAGQVQDADDLRVASLLRRGAPMYLRVQSIADVDRYMGELRASASRTKGRLAA
jgi:hypothetical protein